MRIASDRARCSLRPSSAAQIDEFLAGQRGLGFSYPDVGASRERMTPPGYKESHRRVKLGSGDDAFRRAAAAVRRWAMFELDWMGLHRPEVTPEPGAVVGVSANCWGIRWLNACRVVYVIDEPGRFGFAYGTLPGHAERGEERFLVEIDAAGDVWYDLYSFSRPAHWLAWWRCIWLPCTK